METPDTQSAPPTNERDLKVECTKILWDNPQGQGMKVQVLEGKGAGNVITAKGVIQPPVVGYRYRLIGKMEYDEKWKVWQIFVREAHVLESLSSNGVFNYLIRECPHMGDLMAQQMVDAFGEKTFEVMRDEPDRLLQFDGITPERMGAIHAWAKEEKLFGRVKKFLYELGMKPGVIGKLITHFGQKIVEVVRDDPFKVTEAGGIGFKTACLIADARNIPKNHPSRIRAGVLHTMETMMEEGHTCLPQDKVVEQACKLLGTGASATVEVMLQMVKDKELITHHTDYGAFCNPEYLEPLGVDDDDVH